MSIRKTLGFIILLSILLAVYFNKGFLLDQFITFMIENEEIKLETKNSYYLDYKFEYVHNIDDFTIHNQKELVNLYYTVINGGENSFSFYCPKAYKNCINDVVDLADNQKTLSNINGYIHPFNSFDTVETFYDSLGRVTLKIVKTYTDVEIKELKVKMEEIIETQIKNEKNERKIIKILHDYIINHTIYDKDKSDLNITKYSSNTAYGVLIEGYGICSGYSDAMALFLNYYKIPNFKVVSENHVWNAVFLEGKWYHIDLTWDDPITESKESILDYTYYLISSKKLESLDDNQHNFDKTVFPELVE